MTISSSDPTGEGTIRRSASREVNRGDGVLARALELAIVPQAPADRLRRLVEFVLRQTGASRVGLVRTGEPPRIWVSLSEGEGLGLAQAFADRVAAAMARTRAERAAVSRPPLSPVRLATAAPGREDEGPPVLVALPGGRFLLALAGCGEGGSGGLPLDEVDLLGAVLALTAEAAAAAEEIAVLRARDEERGRFVSTVAHELRTPLTGLAGYLDLLEQKDLAAEQHREFVERSRRIVDSMAELVGDLLELARLEAGSLVLERQPFSVAEATRRVLIQLEPPARQRTVRLEASLPPPLRMACGDRRRAIQVLTNLVGNAVKYAPPGSTVEVAASVEGPFAIWTVRDQGPGIDPDDLERIFQRFYRAPGQETVTGTGLGLPIARELARRMGGEVAATSLAGVGSTFVLLLPAAGGEATPEEMARRLADVLEAERALLLERARLVARSVAGSPPSAGAGRRRPAIPAGSVAGS
jgi:signal transduction histidine kinase